MDIAFRVDASLDIGTGHVARCLTLADALQSAGARCTFVSRSLEGNMIEVIRERGFEAVALRPGLPGDEERQAGVQNALAHGHWLGVDWLTDATETLEALEGRLLDWLVVDHYALDARWQTLVRPSYRRLMVIDDLADRPHKCDLLLDQNLNRQGEDYAGLVPPLCEVLVGPRYAPLRPEFASLRAYSLCRRRGSDVNCILVTMGGVDRENFTSRTLRALANCSLANNVQVNVVMGGNAPWTAQISEIAKQVPFSVNVLVDVRDMAQLMADADLVIGAAGTTAWERCCLGVPSIVMTIAANQRDGARALEKAGAIALIPDEASFGAALAFEIRRTSEPGVLSSLSAAAARITDGKGCMRVTGRMTLV